MRLEGRLRGERAPRDVTAPDAQGHRRAAVGGRPYPAHPRHGVFLEDAEGEREERVAARERVLRPALERDSGGDKYAVVRGFVGPYERRLEPLRESLREL